MGAPRVLLLHNRYRIEGGEERSVALQLAALERAGIPAGSLERRSADVGRGRAAGALLRGGEASGDVAAAVRELGANVLHAHNMQPLFGPRGLAAGREAGAKVVLHLHNARLFCAIAVASRDGGPCFRCRGRFTLPGLVLNCRGSLPEAAAYAAALSAQLPQVLATVDRFVAPSRYAVGQLALLGVPADRLEPLEHYLPADAFAERSGAARGSYALVASRLSEEKGIDTAIEAAAQARVPLRVGGGGTGERRAGEAGREQRRRGGVPRPRRARRDGRPARRRRDAAHALALPRVLALLGAGGDGGRRAGAGEQAGRTPRADRRGALPAPERRPGPRRAHDRPVGAARPARARGRIAAAPREGTPRGGPVRGAPAGPLRAT